MDSSFSRPMVMFAAAILAILALTGFVMGFKDTFTRPRESISNIPAPTSAPSATPAVALQEDELAPASEPESSAAPAPPKPKPKPRPDEDKAADQIDSSTPTEKTPASATAAASAEPAAKPASSRPAASKPASSRPGSKPASGRSSQPPASAAPPPSDDAIGDLLPPH